MSILLKEKKDKNLLTKLATYPEESTIECAYYCEVGLLQEGAAADDSGRKSSISVDNRSSPTTLLSSSRFRSSSSTCIDRDSRVQLFQPRILKFDLVGKFSSLDMFCITARRKRDVYDLQKDLPIFEKYHPEGKKKAGLGKFFRHLGSAKTSPRHGPKPGLPKSNSQAERSQIDDASPGHGNEAEEEEQMKIVKMVQESYISTRAQPSQSVIAELGRAMSWSSQGTKKKDKNYMSLFFTEGTGKELQVLRSCQRIQVLVRTNDYIQGESRHHGLFSSAD
ncbi:hypothetical protein HNY73_004291 [Argiope bruennichi]|uniref:Uncharacterized protein n=1 Tax=Argiope bruennichi TaxID=94029 RepID=A0A8T0FVD5_ARGBR|nr:hypothetical protein HNY73_004291 [Argiope bruennichi]